MRPMQPGDVTATYADVSKLHALTGYRPKVMLEEGLQRFAVWYRDHYGTYGSRLRPLHESYAEAGDLIAGYGLCRAIAKYSLGRAGGAEDKWHRQKQK